MAKYKYYHDVEGIQEERKIEKNGSMAFKRFAEASSIFFLAYTCPACELILYHTDLFLLAMALGVHTALIL